MKVGVYVDGFNLYYGARAICGQGVAGWRWLDIRNLTESCLPRTWTSQGAALDHIVYCTAKVSGSRNPSSAKDQDVYVRALRASGSIDMVEFGTFIQRVKFSPLVVPDGSTMRPKYVRPAWPLMLKDASTETDLPDTTFMVSYLHQEEKGSDVNVGTHLLLDVLEKSVDAAIVISNDSDLKLPIREARKRVPVGTLNPGSGQTAGDLRGQPTDGVGDHWWAPIRQHQYLSNQLPDPVNGLSKPNGW